MSVSHSVGSWCSKWKEISKLSWDFCEETLPFRMLTVPPADHGAQEIGYNSRTARLQTHWVTWLLPAGTSCRILLPWADLPLGWHGLLLKKACKLYLLQTHQSSATDLQKLFLLRLPCCQSSLASLWRRSVTLPGPDSLPPTSGLQYLFTFLGWSGFPLKKVRTPGRFWSPITCLKFFRCSFETAGN